MIRTDAFHRTILEQPDANGPRLVFADWLEEQGDPQAELIRLQVELAGQCEPDRREMLKAREREMLADLDAEWLEPVRDLGLQGRFRRGFLEVTVSGVRLFLESAKRLFTCPWVLHAHLHDGVADLEDIAELAASPYFARLQKLDLDGCRIGNDGMHKLALSPCRCRLTELRVNRARLSTAGLQVLIREMDLSRLIVLELRNNAIGAHGVLDLARSPRLTQLQRLDLSYNNLGTYGGEYLSESRYLGQLKDLFVRGNRIGPRGRKALRRRFGFRVHLGNNDSPF
jgi:uncharacterized protein (TIGR02996 family)